MQRARAVMGALGLSGSKALQKIGTMSGGEKARVALAMFVLVPHNLLILDEPSNHLDVATVEVGMAQPYETLYTHRHSTWKFTSFVSPEHSRFYTNYPCLALYIRMFVHITILCYEKLCCHDRTSQPF
jgi:ABC-type thiamine transport system ATPase subunit